MTEGDGVELRWGVRVPMRDGIRLNATVYLPRNQVAPAPLIVTLTPYISDRYHKRGVYFASHGLPFAIVDVRGRGNSEGVFRPYIQEGADGYDIVEWGAQQSYCNGRVAMWGGSYGGYTQWSAAAQRPAHLATIVPIASPYIGVDFPMRNNIFCPYLVQWLTFTSGRASQERLFADDAFWAEIYVRWSESGRSFADLDTMAGNPSETFQEWISHPHQDEYWDLHNPSAEQYAAMDMPVLTITGSNDDDQSGALEHYFRHLKQGSQQHYLVIGPWDHYGTGTPRAECGGVEFGPASLLDTPKLQLQWYAWIMQGGPRPEFLMKRVAYYVMGAERWRYADTLTDVTARHETWFLNVAGRLGREPGSDAPDSYTYDPRELQGPEVAAEANIPPSSLVDQDMMIALGARQLIYHSSPFEADTEITGFFRLSAWLAIDCRDTDFYVSIYEIGLDGSSIRLTTDAIRARYRLGLRNEYLTDTQEPLLYEFNRFTFVSRQIKEGHHLRLIIAPVGRTNQTLFTQKNFNGGGVVAHESVEQAAAATVKLYHDSQYPSALHTPIGRPVEKGEPTAPESAFQKEALRWT